MSPKEEADLQILRDLLEQHSKLSAALEPLHALHVAPESPLIAAPWAVFELATKQAEALLGDHWRWVSWYIWDNDCGRKALQAGPSGATRKIQTIADLLWVIRS